MRDMTEIELDAIEGIRNGELAPLLAILTKEDPDVHPLVQRYLAQIIVGDESVIDFKLKAEKHRYIRNENMGVNGRAKSSLKSLDIAAKMATHGAFVPSCYESALGEVIKDTGLGKTTITNAWSENKEFLRFCIAYGHFEIDDANRPPNLPARTIPSHIAKMPE